MTHLPAKSPGLFALLVGDGRGPLAVVGLALVPAGGFALFVAARGEFLPHDVSFLGVTPGELCAVNECRVKYFSLGTCAKRVDHIVPHRTRGLLCPPAALDGGCGRGWLLRHKMEGPAGTANSYF
jgi:hypothetical protein